MNIKKGQNIELEISDMAFGGKGIAKVEGYTIFVDQAVPLDQVEIFISRKKKNYAQAYVKKLIKPSPFRVSPPCKYSGYCGGCKWQFLDYNKQIEYKRQHVIESLVHIGQIQDPVVLPTLASENIFAYRNKMEFSCSDKRWLLPSELGKPDIDADFALGLHVPGTFHKVLDIDQCLLFPDRGNDILAFVRSFIRDSKVPVYGLKSHLGFWRFVMLRHSVANNNWMVNLITSTEDSDLLKPLSQALTDTFDEVCSVINNITARKAGIAVGEYEMALNGKSTINDRIGPYEFDISANSFFQTNTRGAAHLYEIAKQYAELKGDETVIDLYSGTGTIAIWLSDMAKEVIGLEINEGAVVDANKNCLKNKITNCKFIAGDVKDSLSAITTPADVMILDPPRTGIHKDVIKQIKAMGPKRMVYVSCNPATMARDLSMLMDEYSLIQVQPVDMFPHTFHIESVAKLEKK